MTIRELASRAIVPLETSPKTLRILAEYAEAYQAMKKAEEKLLKDLAVRSR